MFLLQLSPLLFCHHCSIHPDILRLKVAWKVFIHPWPCVYDVGLIIFRISFTSEHGSWQFFVLITFSVRLYHDIHASTIDRIVGNPDSLDSWIIHSPRIEDWDDPNLDGRKVFSSRSFGRDRHWIYNTIHSTDGTCR